MPVTSHSQNQKKSFLVFFLSVVFLSFGSANVFGQKNEVGFFFGTSYYLGDMNPMAHFAMSRIGFGGLYRFNINQNLSLRANAYWANVEGSDAILQYNTNRNLQFRSNIFEISAQGEVNFRYFTPGDLDTPSTPFIFGGAGIFRFNPQAEINGQWFNLRQLGTEGQGSDIYPNRKPYNLTSVNILFGIGYKFNITRQFSGAFEWGMRRTGTDYLDDVSTSYPDESAFNNNTIAIELYDRSLENRGRNAGFQRGNSNTHDWYSFAGIVLTIRIKDFSKERCPAYN
jgi:hypothetical protein